MYCKDLFYQLYPFCEIYQLITLNYRIKIVFFSIPHQSNFSYVALYEAFNNIVCIMTLCQVDLYFMYILLSIWHTTCHINLSLQ